MRRGVGYNLLFRDNGKVQFLDDQVRWGNSFSFAWQTGVWYNFKLRMEGGVLKGKVWADGSAEPTDWMFTQSGWTNRTGGSVSLNGSSAGTGCHRQLRRPLRLRGLELACTRIRFSGSGLNSAWKVTGGSWSVANGVGSQTSTTSGDPKKLVLTGVSTPAAVEVAARVRVDSWQSGDSARARIGLYTNASGMGYNLLFRDNGKVQFLDDQVRWGNSFSFAWQTGVWYNFKLRMEGGVLKGKVWADGSAEPTDWMFTQSGWTNRTGGSVSLNGSSAGAGKPPSASTTSPSPISLTRPPHPRPLRTSRPRLRPPRQST